VLSGFFYKHNQLLVISLLHFFAMSQHLSVSQPDLLKKLDGEIFKFKQHGPPIFRQNIPCKYGEHCKYGRYSCIYSHESLCKYQKRTSLASTGLVLTSISFHWNTNLLKHFSILKRNFLVNRYAAINKIQPPNANLKAILRHKAARPNAQSFALK